jgi:hypothetical protein
MTRSSAEILAARQTLAAHEAGHCLFTWIHPGATVRRVEYSLVTGVGQVESSWLLHPNVPELMFPAAAMTLSGIAAEIMLVGRFRSRGSTEDFQAARRFSEKIYRQSPHWIHLVRETRNRYPGPDRLDLAAVFQKPPGLAVRQLLLAEYRWARGLLAENELALRRLAGRLYQQPNLTLDELTELLGPQQ